MTTPASENSRAGVDAAALPLSGVRVLDLAATLPGQLACMYLGDLGADVIKVERPNRGDLARALLPGSFESVNRNKRSITVDFSRPAGRQIVLDLAQRSDVLAESFRPGTMARHGLGYEAVHEAVPTLVYCSVSGYGQSVDSWAPGAHDTTIAAQTGILALAAGDGPAPRSIGVSAIDTTTGLCATIGILAALAARANSGRGQWIDQSMYDAAFVLTQSRVIELLSSSEVLSEVDLTAHAGMSVYRCRDRRYLALAAVEDSRWSAMTRLTGFESLDQPEWGTLSARKQDWRRLDARLAVVMAGMESVDVHQRLQAAGIPSSPVETMASAIAAEHTQMRGLIGHDGRNPMVRFPAVLSDTPAQVSRPAPRLGEHSREVLQELGYELVEINRLKLDAVI